jgi:hypothetical protein
MRASTDCPQTVSDKGYHLSGWRDLNSRPLDPQSSAIHTPEFALVRSRRSQPRPDSDGRWRQCVNASELLQSLLQQTMRGGRTKDHLALA